MPRCCIDIARRLFVVAAFATTVAPASALDLDRALGESQAVVGHQVGDYAFTERDGTRVRLSDYRGKPLLVSLVYTGCSQVCPVTTKFLGKAVREAQDTLGRDAFSVVTIGFNLPFDNPAAMKTFAKQQGINLPGWNFLSPDAGTVDGLLRDLGFSVSANASGFDHVTQLTILDADGRVFRQVYGDSFELPILVGALRELADGTPAPVQSLGALVQRVRILCTVYDPLTGKYRLNYALFIEILTGLSVLGAIAYYVSNEWRRQRRASAQRRVA
jgi:protein SCO1/2